MLEDLFQHTRDLPGETPVTVIVEGQNGYHLNETLRGLRAYQPVPPGQSWEYHVLVFNPQHHVDILDFDVQGAKGWELISINYNEGYAFFKRPKQNIPAHICPACGATL